MRDIWNIIGAIAGVLAVAVALFVFLQDRTDKSQRLEVIQISRTTLVNPELASPSRHVEILYNGRKVADYAVFQFRISNVGGQAIRSGDYEVPLAFTFWNVGEVLWADQTASDPQALAVATTVKGKTVELSNALLNPKDWLIVEVAVVPDSGKIPAAEPTGRIAGVKRIEFVLTVPSTAQDKNLPFWVNKAAYLQAFFVLVMLTMQAVKVFRRR